MFDKRNLAQRAVHGKPLLESDEELEQRLSTMFVDAYQKHQEDQADEIEIEAQKLAAVRLRADELASSNRQSDCDHSEDFACVRWFGDVYEFNERQALIVEQLWNAQERRIPWVNERFLFDSLSDAGIVVNAKRLRDVFKSGSTCHPAWGTMIVPEANPNRKNLFGLQEPEFPDKS